MPWLPGIEIARSLIGAGRPPGITEALDFTLWQVDDGVAVCDGSIGVHALNPMGFVHGGYISAPLDTARGFALMSKMAEGHSYTTIDLIVSFLRGLTLESGEVRAKRRVGSDRRLVVDPGAALIRSRAREALRPPSSRATEGEGVRNRQPAVGCATAGHAVILAERAARLDAEAVAATAQADLSSAEPRPGILA